MSAARRAGQPDRKTIEKVMHSVVQIVALRRGMLGNYSSAWTGSGTVVDPSGIILTNCHVANPRAMGMPSPAADHLAVALYYYWQAAVESQVLAYLTGNYGAAVLEELEKSGRPVEGLDYWEPAGQ